MNKIEQKQEKVKKLKEKAKIFKDNFEKLNEEIKVLEKEIEELEMTELIALMKAYSVTPREAVGILNTIKKGEE